MIENAGVTTPEPAPILLKGNKLFKLEMEELSRFHVRIRDVACFFQLRLFNEATIPGYETISGTLPQCVLCFACTCTVLPV